MAEFKDAPKFLIRILKRAVKKDERFEQIKAQSIIEQIEICSHEIGYSQSGVQICAMCGDIKTREREG